MAWKAVALVVVLVTSFSPSELQAQDAAIIVRTFNNFRVPPDQLTGAQAHAAGILKAAGIGVTWLECWHGNSEPLGAPDRCRAATGSDLVLRLHTAAAGNGHHYRSLGFALVVGEGTPFLATVYPDLVEAVARRAGVDASVVLGRAIAHEIGHLLLNSNAHPEDGLMRAAWSQREFRRSAESDWQFLQPEVQKIRASAQHRIDSSRLHIPIE